MQDTSRWSWLVLPPDHPNAPHYWMHETGEELKPAMQLYLTGRAITDRQLEVIKSYVAQWVNSPVWRGSAELARLREDVAAVRNRADLTKAIDQAVEIGMDPL